MSVLDVEVPLGVKSCLVYTRMCYDLYLNRNHLPPPPKCHFIQDVFRTLLMRAVEAPLSNLVLPGNDVSSGCGSSAKALCVASY